MDNKRGYNLWADNYDGVENKTRDAEAKALKEMLSNIEVNSCLEIGCGTGKNTGWLASKANKIVAVDFSEEMLNKARLKHSSPHIQFIIADINKPWHFTTGTFDLVSFSLVLEHISNLEHILAEAKTKLLPGGYIYIGELHPFKQYDGSKARFQIGDELHILDCYLHHTSDYITAAKNNGLHIIDIQETFDDDNRNGLPRILAMLLRK